MHPSYKMTLADGFSLQITAGDAKAAPVIELLARAMMLEHGGAEAVLQVLTGKAEELFLIKGERFLCRILPPEGPDGVANGAFQVSLAIAHMAQKRGGILVHGGLAEFREQGIILAAPGATGKTTAFNRLPAPWRPLSDDAALIVRNVDNGYFGHPWPTWSRLIGEQALEEGYSWDVHESVPLRAVFFLEQGETDRTEPVGPGHTAGMLAELAQQTSRYLQRDMTPDEIAAFNLQRFNNLCDMAKTIPSYTLHVTLDGSFWEAIEQVLSHEPGATP